MEQRFSREEDASDTSNDGSSDDEDDEDEEVGDEDHYSGGGGDDDSNNGQKHKVSNRRGMDIMLVETPSSNETPPRAAPVKNAAGGGGTTTTNAQNQASSAGTPPIAPHRKDVLLGRGRPYQNFGGNKRMLRIVARYKEEYAARPRDQKRLFVETVLDAVLKDGTRFLRRVDDSDEGSSDQWEEVDRSTAADKVWHALRSKDRSMKSKDKSKGSRQEGNGDDDSVLSRSSRMKNEERHNHHRHNLAVSHDTTTSSHNETGGLIDKNDSSNALQERSHEERDRTTSVSVPPTVDSLTRDIVHHLNKAVQATNSLSALIGAHLDLPPAAASLTLSMMRAGASQTGDNRIGGQQAQALQQPDQSIVAEVAAIKNNTMFLPAEASLGASLPSPFYNQVQSTAPMLPFSSLAGLMPAPSVAQYLSTLSNVGVSAGGLMGPPQPVPGTFPDARQIAQMAALYPRLFSGGNAVTSVPPSSSNHQHPHHSPVALAGPQPTNMMMDRSQQIFLQALATLSQQATQHGSAQPPGPP